MTIEVKQKLHGIDIANFHGGVKQGENEEFAIRGELDTHNFICGFNLFIELKLNLTSGVRL